MGNKKSCDCRVHVNWCTDGILCLVVPCAISRTMFVLLFVQLQLVKSNATRIYDAQMHHHPINGWIYSDEMRLCVALFMCSEYFIYFTLDHCVVALALLLLLLISLKRSIWMFLVITEHVRTKCGRTIADIHVVHIHVSRTLCDDLGHRIRFFGEYNFFVDSKDFEMTNQFN